MPQNTPITIKDGAATPVDHVFSPSRIDQNGVALFAKRDGTVLIGQHELSYSARPQGVNGSAGTTKVTVMLKRPAAVVATGSNGVQSTIVDFQDLGKIEMVFSTKGTLERRRDMRVMLANALLHPTLEDAIDNVEGFW